MDKIDNRVLAEPADVRQQQGASAHSPGAYKRVCEEASTDATKLMSTAVGVGKISIEIDGKKLHVDPGSMIIEAADAAKIFIPRFCYHKKLSIAANCRMCLVEVEKSGKPLPACATPVTSGMVVHTRSTKAIDAQRSVMEFLLINHPLDCPICDQGGECELQDLAMGYGKDISRFSEGKRSVKDKDIGPLIATDMTRCIHCTRCVRFGEEVAGKRELGAIGRGERMEISTYINHCLKSELSGNVIDLCPVGALTSKPYRFKARAWELNQHPSIAPHDCIGSNINIHRRRQEVLRVVPQENESLNECWLSDRDRFSYTGLVSPDRIGTPLIKQEGSWQETDWTTAFKYVVAGLEKIIASHGPEQIAAIASPSATLEELYLLQKLMRALGSNNIDHRLRQTDISDQNILSPVTDHTLQLTDLEHADTVLLIGSNLHYEQPIAGHRLRKNFLRRNATIACLNPLELNFNFDLTEKIIVSPCSMVNSLLGVVLALASLTSYSLPPSIEKLVPTITPSDEQQHIARLLKEGKKIVILLGALANNHPQAASLRGLAKLLAEMSHGHYCSFTDGANSSGAWLAGAIPHRDAVGHFVKAGLSVNQALSRNLAAYLLWGVEPELDCANPQVAQQTLKNAEFVIAFSSFAGESLKEYADIILPITPFTETSGTYVNIEGSWQSFIAAVPPFAEARPGWKVLRVLGNLLSLSSFDYQSSQDVCEEVKNLQVDRQLPLAVLIPELSVHQPNKSHDLSLTRITEWPIYLSDMLVRRAQPLQDTQLNSKPTACLHPQSATQLQLHSGMRVMVTQEHQGVELVIEIDPRIPEGCVYIPAGYKETSNLGASFGPVSIKIPSEKANSDVISSVLTAVDLGETSTEGRKI